MGEYAKNTSVSVEKSKGEIDRTLQRYGADQFISGWDTKQNMAMIGFSMNSRQIRFFLPLPEQDDPEFTKTPTGKRKKPDAALAAWEQGCRQRWRALALMIKAKLEAVESGITEFEDEFMAHIILPNGTTFGDWAKPQIEEAYVRGTMPSMLPALPRGSSNE
jgi:hypothetical protein